MFPWHLENNKNEEIAAKLILLKRVPALCAFHNFSLKTWHKYRDN